MAPSWARSENGKDFEATDRVKQRRNGDIGVQPGSTHGTRRRPRRSPGPHRGLEHGSPLLRRGGRNRVRFEIHNPRQRAIHLGSAGDPWSGSQQRRTDLRQPRKGGRRLQRGGSHLVRPHEQRDHLPEDTHLHHSGSTPSGYLEPRSLRGRSSATLPWRSSWSPGQSHRPSAMCWAASSIDTSRIPST